MKFVPCASMLLLVFLIGCGGASGPKTAPVSGKVTAGGEPFKKGLVRFVPAPDSNLNSREAITDDQGNYKIMFSADQAGLEPGDYTVHFSLWQMEDGSPPPDQTGEANPKSPKDLGAVQWVPNEYLQGTAPECKVTVGEAGGKFDFDLPELKPQTAKK